MTSKASKKELYLALIEKDTGFTHVVYSGLESADLQDWNTAVAIIGEVEDMVQVITTTE